jgi:anaphase-promoting complex subunit 3
MPKRLRSTTRKPDGLKSFKPMKQVVDEPLKKARLRPALTFANFFSSSGRRSQTVTSSRPPVGVGKSNIPLANTGIATRRSTRLQTGTVTKQNSKVEL